MVEGSDFDSEIYKLKIDPTVSAWEIEIRRVLIGKREHALIKLGSIQEYVENILDGSEDQAMAQTAFNEALRNVIQSWQPTRPESPASLSCMLDLIGAYTPAEGFTKILGFINSRRYFGDNVITPDSRVLGKDLHLKALFALQYFYPAAPPSHTGDDIAFKQYLDVLREHLKENQYCDYALRRLYELNVISLEDPDVEEVLETKPEVIKELISTILRQRNKSKVERALSLLYAYSLRYGEEEHFRNAIELKGGLLEHDSEGPVIYLSKTDALFLKLPEDVQESYILIRWKSGPLRGMDKLSNLMIIHSNTLN
jgi:hypothetical protein